MYIVKQKNKTKKGFSLLETLIAILVFSLAMVMLVGVFSNFLKNYAKVKKTQKNIENAQYTMNLMAKTIRTSEIASSIGPDVWDAATNLDLFNYSQGKCIRYSYNGSAIQVQTNTGGTPATLADCDFNSLTSPANLVTNITGASISATPTINGGASPVYGRVTISLKVQDGASEIPIQMTVSLRQ